MINIAGTEEDELKQMRHVLSYTPQNVWQMAPYTEPTDDPNRQEEELLSIISRKRTRTYNPYQYPERR